MAMLVLLEDDLESRQAYSSALEDAGFAVYASASVEPPVWSRAPDLVIVDLQNAGRKQQGRRYSNPNTTPTIALLRRNSQGKRDFEFESDTYFVTEPVPAETLVDLAKAMLVPAPDAA